ncbi:hypothetical protein JCM8097_009150 [Rhodosporidiobolus ruineniae]
MRWLSVLGLSAQLGVLVALASPAASSPPAHSSSSHQACTPPTTQSITLADLLSASADHQLLLAAFQRARLIPTLNRLNGSTLFAPTDDAIRNERKRERALHKTGHAPAAQLAVWSSVVDWVEQGKPERLESEEEDGEGEKGDDEPRHDNLQLALRDTLLYHVLNYTLFPAPPTNSSDNSTAPAPKPLPLDIPTLQETLYFPSLFPYNRSFPAPPSLPGTEPEKPDPDAPKDRPEGLLHGEGQRLGLLKRKKGGEIWVGGDWKGEGGVKASSEPEFATNGALVSLDGVLQKPNDVVSIIRSTPELSTLASLLPPPVLDFLTTAPHLTLFAPTNEAWGVLSELEMKYLRSGFAELDLAEIFGGAASQAGAGKGKVGYLERLVGFKGGKASTITTIRNGTLEVTGGQDKTDAQVNGTAIVTGDILAKNGVIHTVPSLLLPSGSLSLTAEKYLIALDATDFVALLRSVNLSHYVQVPSHEPGTVLDSSPLPPIVGTDDVVPQISLSASAVDNKPRRERYTILAVKDDVLASAFSDSSASSRNPFISSPVLNGHPLPPEGSAALKELLAYHIVTGRWTPDELDDGMLVGTELRTDLLRGARQRVVVGVQGEDGSRGEGWASKGKGKKGKGGDEREKGTISWGGATVVAEPVAVGGSIIYLVSSLIDPPPTAITAAVSDLRLSTFVASVYAAALDGILSMQPAVTYLVPTNDAFESLGLTMSYLLLPSSRAELRTVLKYHAVDEVVYLDGFPRTGGARYATLLDGTEIYFERDSTNGTLSVHGPTLGGVPANGETRDASIVEGDILTETGALHIVDQVELPAELDITLEKLLLGAKANTMVELIKAANMSWVLEGKAPPQPSKHKKQEVEGAVGTQSYEGRGKHGEERYAGSNDRAYTILCPSDKAFSRLNLTYYRTNPPALEALVRLHIIPDVSSSSSLPTASPAEPGAPLALGDTKSYKTLLDESQPGGSSAYGAVAFRKWGAGDSAWLVGVEGARGVKGEADAARVVQWGRATPWLVEDDGPSAAGKGTTTRLVPAGGVISLDAVLLPYEPGWFRRWGWIVLSSIIGVAVLAVFAFVAVRRYRKRREAKYERLLQEEDDD